MKDTAQPLSAASRYTVDILRGVAIIVIMINHFVNQFTDNYSWYGNGMVTIFFILSGYSIYYSLERRLKKNSSLKKVIVKFYKQRFMRIYPLFIISLVLFYWQTGQELSVLPFIGIARFGVYWFITAIIYCYLIAPFLFFVLKRISLTRFVIGMLLLFVILAIASLWLRTFLIPWKFMFFYRNIAFSYIFAFSLGMTIPLMLKYVTRKFYYRSIICVASIIFVIMLHFSRPMNELILVVLSAYLLIITAWILVLFLLLHKYSTRIYRVIQYFGKYSYVFYLFHYLYFRLIAAISSYFIDDRTTIILVSLITSILFFPLFMYMAVMLEKASRLLSSRVLQLK